MGFSPKQAREYYNWFGSAQDQQAWYEDAAVQLLSRRIDWEHVDHVLEIGGGTGRWADYFLRHHLSSTASYQMIDVSQTMVGLNKPYLERWQPRYRVDLIDGSIDSLVEYWSTHPRQLLLGFYVFDIFSDAMLTKFFQYLDQRVMPQCQVAMVNLSLGQHDLSRLVSMTWHTVHSLWPSLVGRCRPMSLAAICQRYCPRWKIDYRHVVTRWGIPSEILLLHPKI